MTAGWTAGCRCVSLTRHTPAATSEASCFDACARSTCCQMPWDAMECHGKSRNQKTWCPKKMEPQHPQHPEFMQRHIAAHCTMVSPRKFQWFRVKARKARKARHFCPTYLRQLLQDGPGLSEREQQDDGQHVLPREKGSWRNGRDWANWNCQCPNVSYWIILNYWTGNFNKLLVLFIRACWGVVSCIFFALYFFGSTLKILKTLERMGWLMKHAEMSWHRRNRNVVTTAIT